MKTKKEIDGKKISFSYLTGPKADLVLREIDFYANRGELVAVLGRNGCGKSTLARHFNALLPLQQGELTVGGIDVRNQEEIWRLRRLCGMVFQNPDNQFVSSVLEEDIAFGLENYETPEEQIPEKTEAALRLVGLDGMGKRAPHTLSGGQKQRATLAGVLALDPSVLIFDEATAMLDPDGRREVLAVIRRLHREAGKTIIMITHYAEEAVAADRIVLMEKGRIAASGTPREVLADQKLLSGLGLAPPFPVKMYYDLLSAGIQLERCPLTTEELVEELCRLN